LQIFNFIKFIKQTLKWFVKNNVILVGGLMKNKLPLYILIFIMSLILVNCAFPRYIWPQKDINAYTMNEHSLEQSVLIVSRSSEFKDAVVRKIGESFKEQPVYLKFIGLNELEQQDVSKYSAIVIVNTCIGWGIDRKTKAFLDKTENQDNIIILTTSGDGGWMPQMKDYTFDAVSSASELVKVDEIADKIIGKLNTLL